MSPRPPTPPPAPQLVISKTEAGVDLLVVPAEHCWMIKGKRHTLKKFPMWSSLATPPKSSGECPPHPPPARAGRRPRARLAPRPQEVSGSSLLQEGEGGTAFCSLWPMTEPSSPIQFTLPLAAPHPIPPGNQL